jgi:hypothetical protein
MSSREALMNILRTAALAAALACAAVSSHANQVLAYAQSGDGARVVLYTSTGPCVGLAKFAEHIARDGGKTPGCWLMTTTQVQISFFDGERGAVPLDQLKRTIDS